MVSRARHARPDLPAEGRRRVVIEAVTPAVDGGRFPVKRVVGDELIVEADVFADGHDGLVVRLLHGALGADPADWMAVPMQPLGNDRWQGSFSLAALGRHGFTVEGWTDRFVSWRRELGSRWEAGQDVRVELVVGAELLEEAEARAEAEAGAQGDTEAEAGAQGDTEAEAGPRGQTEARPRVRADARRLATAAARLRRAGAPRSTAASLARAVKEAQDEALLGSWLRHPDRRFATRLERPLEVVVDPLRARFSSWYELFPRSASPDPDRPGTLRDVIELLPRLQRLGFDVLYLPPIHPIGRTDRKGRDDAETAGPDDPGSPWAIGAAEGGHTAIHPELGTLDDFADLVAAARTHDIEVCLDLAFQASPDHPEVRRNPAWFRHRPDGTIRFAENPPKRYQDIYPFDFESAAWRGLWRALEGVVEAWIGRGVRIFRVDNPHTKPFAFWAWLIEAVKERHPEVIFLAEAFTRPKIMHRLAKLGFSQSYTYFTWRTGKAELETYFTELTQPPVSDFFRPNLWPNTPDILHAVLQTGGRPAFGLRAVLAATLGANWGVYGAPFETLQDVPREPGTEEYLQAEKYEVRHWRLDEPGSLAPLLGRLNAIRRAEPALQRDDGLRFATVDNEQLIAYTKQAVGASTILCVVNLDPHHVQAGTVELPPETFRPLAAGGALGPPPTDAAYVARDLLDGARYAWQGGRNGVVLDPAVRPAHVFRLEAGTPGQRP